MTRPAAAVVERGGGRAPVPEPAAAPERGAAAAELGNQAMQKALAGGGVALDDDTRSAAEARLGIGLGHVRVHRGGAAEKAARRVSARAFLAGSNIVLGRAAGRDSLAHELVHVAQQARNGAASADGGASAEREAARLAPALLGGGRVRPTAALGPGIHREDLTCGPEPAVAEAAEETCEPEEPSFRAADVDVAGMTNELLNTESLRVDDWLRANPNDPGPDLPEYRELGKMLRLERQGRVRAGHLWMAEAGREMPTALYQLVGGGDRIHVQAADLAAAFGLPDTSQGDPIMSPGQFDQYLTAHGIEKVTADSPQAQAALNAASASPYEVCDPNAPAPEEAPAGQAAATGENDPLRTPPGRGPMLATPLPPGRPFPYGTLAEGPVTATYYPGAVTLPRAYPGYDAVRGGIWDSTLGFEGPKKARVGVVTQTIQGGEWIGIKTLMGPEQATPTHIDEVVRKALNDMVNKKGVKRDPTPVDTDTYWRVAPSDPDKAVVHILIPEEAARSLPELQAAADRRVAGHGFGADLPPQVEARVTVWEGRPRGSPEATPGPIQPAGTPGSRIGVGAGASGVIAITVGGIQMLVDARDHPEWAAELAAQGGRGVLNGGAQQIIEEAAVKSGGRLLPGATSTALRTLGRRVGSGVTSGVMEIYDMRANEPYYHSPEEQVVRPLRAAAIGVASTEIGFYAGAAAVAPATAGALFIMSAAGYGAAAGSVAPVVGTAIGFIVGLAVGVAAYAIMDAATPGGREDWDHNAPGQGGAGGADGQGGAGGARGAPGVEEQEAAERLRDAETRMHAEGTPFAGGIDDNAMPAGLGLRQDEKDTCIP